MLYRFLRYLNSPWFAFNEIHSVATRPTILVERETRRWIRLVALIPAGMLKSTDLVLSALLRTASANCFPRKPPWRSPTCFPLCPVYQLMLAQEAGRWEQAKEFAAQLHISQSETGERRWAAMKWDRQVSSRT